MFEQTDDDVLDLAAAADLCGVSQVTIRRWVHEGRLKSWRHGRKTYVLDSALIEVEYATRAHRERTRPKPAA